MRSLNSSTQLILLLAFCATVTVGQTVYNYESNVVGDRLGAHVAFCDVNNDTYTDLVSTSTTSVFVFLGDNTGQFPASPNFKYNAGAVYNGTTTDGLSLACGDLNQDGYDDVVVGNWTGSSTSPYQTQYVSIWNGTASGIAATAQVMSVTGAGFYGCSLDIVDINNDGKKDLLVGAYGAARIYIHFGTGAGGVASTPTAPASLLKSLLTWSLAFDHCDLNGDNLPELLVAARTANAGAGSSQGQVWIMGNTNGNTFTNALVLNGTAAGALFGYDVKCGDFNNDGHNDAAILAQGTKYLYVYYGTGSVATFPTVPSVSINLVDTCRSLSVGDINQDTYPDILVGCHSANKVKIYYGGPTLGGSNSSGFTYTPTVISGSPNFGWSVRAGPNIDNSGLNDIAVGSYNYNNTEVNEGQVNVLYMNGIAASPTPSVTPSITPTASVTPSISVSPSMTPSVSPTASVTPSISVSPSATPSISTSPSVTPSISASASVSPSTQPSPSESPSPIPSSSSSPSVTPTISPSNSPSATPSISVSPSATPSISVSPSTGSSPSSTPSVTPSISVSSSVTPSSSASPSKTPSPAASVSSSPSVTPSISVSPSPVIPSSSSSPSVTPSSSSSASSSASPTASTVPAVSTSPSASSSAAAASVSPSPEIKKTYTDCKMTLEGDTFDEQQFIDDMAVILNVDPATLDVVSSSKKSIDVTLRIFDTPGQDSVAVAKDLQNLVATSDPILAENGISITSLTIDDSHAASAQEDASSSGLSTGGIVAIAVVVPVAALALVGLAFVAYKKKNSRSSGSSGKREVELANVETKKKQESDEETGTSESDETSDSEDDTSSDEESSEEDSESSEETSESETASKSKASDSSSESESSSA